VSAGPCGGTALAVEPFPAILVAIFGLELIVCSYLLVKSLKVESDFRVIIYLFLVLWTLSLLAPAVDLVRSGVPRLSEDLNDFYFSMLRGFAAAANLFLFLSIRLSGFVRAGCNTTLTHYRVSGGSAMERGFGV